MKFRFIKIFLVAIVTSFISTVLYADDYDNENNRGYCLNANNENILNMFLSGGIDFPIASAVRGGVFPDWIPEMSMASFKKSIELAPAIIEVRPNVSSDGVVFLLPDLTLDRTTTGTGFAQAQGWEALSNLSLLDNKGRVTTQKIPTLQQALEWSDGKTILQINMLNELIGVNPGLSSKVIDIINSLDAHNRVMMISWSNQQAKDIYDLDNRLPIAVFSLNEQGIEDAVSLGINRKNIVPTLSFDVDYNYASYLQNNGHTPAYITYFLESSDLTNKKAKAIYKDLKNKGMIIQATTQLNYFSTAFDFSNINSPYLTRGCLGAVEGPLCDGKVATIVGSDNMDVIVGTQGDDVIVAGAGDDIITGGGGKDIICGGTGNDIIYSGDGRDRIFGEQGNDILYGGKGKDLLDGGEDFDSLDGGKGKDSCLNGEGFNRCE